MFRANFVKMNNMAEVNTFEEIEKLMQEAETAFRKDEATEFGNVAHVFSTIFSTLRSVAKFHPPEEWKDSREEYVLAVLIQALETVLAMYSLSKNGFWDNALVLKRNYSELLAVAIAVGYDKQCFIDWKNDRDQMKGFDKICRRINESESVPEVPEKQLLKILQKYWNESSQTYSHNTALTSIRTIVADGQVKFEPKVSTSDFRNCRLRTVRNMLINIQSILLGIFDYGSVTEMRKDEFPEALAIIDDSNRIFSNLDWREQETK